MEIKAGVLNARNFSDYGQVITAYEGEPMADDDVITYYGKVGEISCDGLLSTGYLVGHKRAFSTDKLERHMNTPEVLVALDGDALILAALPDEQGNVENVSAFHIKQGEAVVLDKAAWHWTPFPTEKDYCVFLVIFKDNTESDDLDIRELDTPIVITP